MAKILMLAQNASSARTPLLWNKALKKLGIDASVHLRDVECKSSTELKSEIHRDEYQAVILGHPNKLYATQLVTLTNVESTRSGLNLLIRTNDMWQGFNFDGTAFSLSLFEEFPTLASESLFLFLGTGSTANSCSTEVISKIGYESVRLIPRSYFANPKDDIFHYLNLRDMGVSEKSVVVVNCTPMGKFGYPIPKNLITKLCTLYPVLFYDINYYFDQRNPWTDLIQSESVRDGKRMNLIQAALGFHEVFLQEAMSKEESVKFFESLQ